MAGEVGRKKCENGPSVPFQLLVYHDSLVANSFSGEEPVLTFVPQLNRVWDVLFLWEIVTLGKTAAGCGIEQPQQLAVFGMDFLRGQIRILIHQHLAHHVGFVLSTDEKHIARSVVEHR